MTVTRISSIIRQVLSIAAIVIASLTSVTLPAGVRVVLASVGGFILAAEHVLSSLNDPDTAASALVNVVTHTAQPDPKPPTTTPAG
jgi:hypothetical protein